MVMRSARKALIPDWAPDALAIMFFTIMGLVCFFEPDAARFLVLELVYWFVFEAAGSFFLQIWAGLHENRENSSGEALYRSASMLGVYAIIGALMYFGMKVPPATIAISSIAGCRAFLNPFTWREQPTGKQIGREAAAGMVALMVSFFGMGFVGSLLAQALPRPIDHAVFDSVIICAIASCYYVMRYFLANRILHKT